MKANKGGVRLSRKMSDQRATETHVNTRCNSVPSDYTHTKEFWKSFSPRIIRHFTHSVVQVLGQRVDEDYLARGRGAVQADGGVEVVVPEHGLSQQSDQQRDDQDGEQRDQPTQDRHACGAGQVSDVTATWEGDKTRRWDNRAWDGFQGKNTWKGHKEKLQEVT